MERISGSQLRIKRMLYYLSSLFLLASVFLFYVRRRRSSQAPRPIGQEIELHRDPSAVLEALRTSRRIRVMGCSSSGKSTLAANIAEARGVRYIEGDELMWLPGWRLRDPEEVRAMLHTATSEDAWTLAGNTRDAYALSRTELIIFLHLSFWMTMRRGIVRTFRRCWYHEMCCNGNFETFSFVLGNIFTESIPAWIWKTHAGFPARVEKLSQECPHIRIIVLRSAEKVAWISNNMLHK